MLKPTSWIILCIAVLLASIPLSTNEAHAADTDVVPIVMVHGYDDDGESWKKSDFKKWLVTNGYSTNHLYYADYSEFNRNDVTGDDAQEVMDKIVRKAMKKSRSLGNKGGEIDIVVHSMGGLITRWYLYEALQRKDEKLLSSIRKVVFIGTPNRGSQVAFYNRVADMLDDPSDYFGDLREAGNEHAADIERYVNLYNEYADFAFLNRKALISYEQWLYQEHPDVMAEIALLEKTGMNPVDNNIGDDPLDGGYPYRYSEGFAEYVKLMYGRLRSRGLMYREIPPQDSKLKPYLETSMVDEGTRVKEWGGSDTAKNIVQDRLMSETFSIFTQLNKNGKKERDVITANVFLDKLNREEAQYRYARVMSGKPVPQYITIATKTDAWWGILPHFDYNVVETAMDDKRWGLWDYTMDSVIHHDSVVPIGNVQLPQVLADRHVYDPGRDIPHSEQMDADDLLSAQMLHPLTGSDDASNRLVVRDGEANALESNIVVIAPDETLQGESIDVSIRANGYGAQGAYVLGRDAKGMIKHISRFNKCTSCSTFAAEVRLDFDAYTDYVVLNPDSDDASMSNDLIYDHVRYTVTYTGADLEERSDVTLTPIRDELTPGGRTITMRATDTVTGEPLEDLIGDDFDVDGAGKFYVDRDRSAAISRDGTLAVVLDYSGSMDGLPLAQSKQGAEQFMLNLPEDMKLGVYGFADETTNLHDYSQDHLTASSSVYADLTGGTAMYDAIVDVVAELVDEPGEKAMLLMTDGGDTDSETSMKDAIALAVTHGIRIHVVGLGGVDQTVLTEVADRTGGMLFFTADPRQLAAIYETIAESETTTYDILLPSSADRGSDVTIGLRSDKRSAVTVGGAASYGLAGSDYSLGNGTEEEESTDGILTRIGRRLTLGWLK